MKTRLLQTALALCVLIVPVTLSAGAYRTFVASTGNDANPCSLTLPCRSFAAAVLQTYGNGEIIVLDSAGYGPVAINQSVSITAPPGVYAGISVPPGQIGVTISGAGSVVQLRGLSINSTGGDYGIRVTFPTSMNVEQCTISNFASLTGIAIEAPSTVTISDTVLRDNNNGVVMSADGNLNLTNSQVIRSSVFGLLLAPGVPGAKIDVFITDTLFTGIGPNSVARCIANIPSPAMTSNISATRITVTGCGSAIWNGYSGTGTIAVSGSMVTGNIAGFVNNAGTFGSLGNNHVSGNTTDTFGVITKTPPI